MINDNNRSKLRFYLLSRVFFPHTVSPTLYRYSFTLLIHVLVSSTLFRMLQHVLDNTVVGILGRLVVLLIGSTWE